MSQGYFRDVPKCYRVCRSEHPGDPPVDDTTAPSVLQSFRLDGRRALVTGGARGLGREIARALAEAGARVWLNGRDAAALGAAVVGLRDAGLAAEAAVFDVADAAARDAWFDAAGADAPDILVNNVGARDRRAVHEMPAADFERLLEVNLTTAYALTRLALPAMRARGRGVVLNVTSIAGPVARAADPAYTASKGGLAALTRSLAVEVAPLGIRVNAIAPGYFATEANREWIGDPEVERVIESRIPMARWGEPREIAAAALFLCSDAASFVTGETINVDGGHSVKM